MITRSECEAAKKRAGEMIREAGIGITDKEIAEISVVDLGLSDLENEGVQVATFFNTKRICMKIIALWPNQTEPEHWHPAVDDDPGKEEVCRVIKGECRFYIAGEDTLKEGFIPKGKDSVYTLRHEVVCKPTDQIWFKPGEKHWFQAGPEGCVMYCISSCARDLLDQFTDPGIDRDTKIDESK